MLLKAHLETHLDRQRLQQAWGLAFSTHGKGSRQADGDVFPLSPPSAASDSR